MLLMGVVTVCIVEHMSICLTECFPRGESTVQRLIDAGALICWKEENGLEMVAEFTRSVGGNTKQATTIKGTRERCFFLVCVCLCDHLLGLMSIRVLAFRIQFSKLGRLFL